MPPHSTHTPFSRIHFCAFDVALRIFCRCCNFFTFWNKKIRHFFSWCVHMESIAVYISGRTYTTEMNNKNKKLPKSMNIALTFYVVWYSLCHPNMFFSCCFNFNLNFCFWPWLWFKSECKKKQKTNENQTKNRHPAPLLPSANCKQFEKRASYTPRFCMGNI